MLKRQVFLGFFMAAVFLCCVSVSLAETYSDADLDISKWETYCNKKYGYEIKYPKDSSLWPNGFELLVTGLKGQRDGKTFFVGPKEYRTQGTVLGLSVEILPHFKKEQIMEERGFAKFCTPAEDVIINGQNAKKCLGHCYKSNEICRIFVFLDGALFSYKPKWLERDFTPLAEQIIKTFRFYKK